MAKEEWKQYPSDPRYLVSNKGQIQGANGTIMKRQKSGVGYFAVKIYNKSTLVHRIVAETWLPNPENHKAVGFIDFDKSNCSVDNLYWTASRLKFTRAAWESILLMNIETRQEIHAVNYRVASEIVKCSQVTLGKVLRGELKNSKVQESWHVLLSPIPRSYFIYNGLETIYGPEAEKILKEKI
jgi:hypothetical protein